MTQTKFSLQKWLEPTALPFLLGRELEDFHYKKLYKAMDILEARKDEILGRLYQKRSFKPNLLFYDLTSSYFEGRKAELGAYGYSRDHRQDRLQMVIGLTCDEEGVPIEFEVYPGNTQDKTTVIEKIKNLKENYGIEKVILVKDKEIFNKR